MVRACFMLVLTLVQQSPPLNTYTQFHFKNQFPSLLHFRTFNTIQTKCKCHCIVALSNSISTWSYRNWFWESTWCPLMLHCLSKRGLSFSADITQPFRHWEEEISPLKTMIYICKKYNQDDTNLCNPNPHPFQISMLNPKAWALLSEMREHLENKTHQWN